MIIIIVENNVKLLFLLQGKQLKHIIRILFLSPVNILFVI